MHLSYRNRNIAISVALALGAALLVTLYVKNHNNNNNVASNLGKDIVNVFVASGDIPANTPGADLGGLVRPEQIPRKDVVPGAISNQDQVKGLVSTAPIYAGEMVTSRRFQPLANEGTPGQVTGNSRVIQLPGDPNQLLVGTLQAGNHVDVVANLHYQLINFRQTRTAGLQQQVQLVATRIVLRNLLVLREPQPPAGSGKFGGTKDYQVLLSLTDSQAEKLFFVTKNGDWSLQLRPAHGAVDSPETVESTGSILIDGLKAPQFNQLVLGPGGP
jgi:Flp pilus assembly protein CpaB